MGLEVPVERPALAAGVGGRVGDVPQAPGGRPVVCAAVLLDKALGRWGLGARRLWGLGLLRLWLLGGSPRWLRRQPGDKRRVSGLEEVLCVLVRQLTSVHQEGGERPKEVRKLGVALERAESGGRSLGGVDWQRGGRSRRRGAG